MVGSVLLTDFASREEVEAWVADDPYVTGGVWKDIEVLDFRACRGRLAPRRLTRSVAAAGPPPGSESDPVDRICV